MKNTFKLFVLTTIILGFVACNADLVDIPANPDFVLSITEKGDTAAAVGTTFYVKNTGTGEFLTLFDGTEGKVWGEPGAKGTDFNGLDSLPVTYNKIGYYKLTVVATSTGNFGKNSVRVVKSQMISALDFRSAFKTISINGVEANISVDNKISVALLDTTKNIYNVTYTLTSDDAKVYINGVEQISGTKPTISLVPPTSDTNTLTYTVRSLQGTETLFPVTITTYAPSSEKKLIKLQLLENANGYVNSNGEIAEIDNDNMTVKLALNYATLSNKSRIKPILSSVNSSVSINNVPYIYSATKNWNLGTINSIQVKAQDGSISNYAFSTTLQDPVTTFTFEGLVPAPIGIIDPVAKTISVDVLKGTDITKLVAKWTGTLGIVKIGTVEQTNATTVNDFSSSKAYTFYKGAVAGDTYTVTVHEK